MSLGVFTGLASACYIQISCSEASPGHTHFGMNVTWGSPEAQDILKKDQFEVGRSGRFMFRPGLIVSEPVFPPLVSHQVLKPDFLRYSAGQIT